MRQLHAATLTGAHSGFSIEVRKRISEAKVWGMDPVLHFGLPRTFRRASAKIACPEMLFG